MPDNRTYPQEKLDPKVKAVWRIDSALLITFIFAFFIIPLAIISTDVDEVQIFFVLSVIAYIIFMVIFVIVWPTIRYANWRYQLTEDFLELAYGVIWKKRILVPFIRVQNTDTVQGPVLRAFKLSSVTVSTAGGSHQIPGIDRTQADILRDRAAELARLAREDV